MLHLSKCVLISAIGVVYAETELWRQRLEEGVRLREAGHYAEAEKLFRQALAETDQFGADDERVAIVLLSLGQGYISESRYTDSAAVLRRSLAIAEKTSARRLEARVLNSLGELARVQARYVEAAAFYLRSRQVAQALGPDRPELAAAMHNLALVYKATGRYAEAEKLIRESLAIWDKCGQSARVGAAYNSLGDLRLRQARYKEAETYFTRALTLTENLVGASHPSVGAILVNRSVVLDHQRRYAESESDLQRALRILENSLGPQDPRTIACLNSLGLVAHYQGREREAEDLLTRSLEMKEKVAGPEHPDLAATLTNLGVVYRAEGRYGDAEAALARALAIQAKTAGTDPNTAGTMMEYARVLRVMKRKQEAGEMEARARAIAVRHAQTSFAGYTVDAAELRN